MKLLWAIFLFIVSRGNCDITGTSPSSGSTLCFDLKFLLIPYFSSDCNFGVTIMNTGSCMVYTGTKQNCSILDSDLELFQITIGNDQVLVSGIYLVLDNSVPAATSVTAATAATSIGELPSKLEQTLAEQGQSSSTRGAIVEISANQSLSLDRDLSNSSTGSNITDAASTPQLDTGSLTAHQGYKGPLVINSTVDGNSSVIEIALDFEATRPTTEEQTTSETTTNSFNCSINALMSVYPNLMFVDTFVLTQTETESCSDDESCQIIIAGLLTDDEEYDFDILVGSATLLYPSVFQPVYNCSSGALISDDEAGAAVDTSLKIAFIGNYTTQLPPSDYYSTIQLYIDCALSYGFVTADYIIKGVSKEECGGPCTEWALYQPLLNNTHYKNPRNDILICLNK